MATKPLMPAVKPGSTSDVELSTWIPPVLLAPPYVKVMIKTDGGNSIVLDDTPGIGGITLETSGGQKIKMSATGIEIDNGMGGTISMIGPKVSINNDALEVLF